MIESKLKMDKDKGRLGEETYWSVTFTIFYLVLFTSEATGIISMETSTAFIEYEQVKNNLMLAILIENFLSLNHCRLHEKWAM